MSALPPSRTSRPAQHRLSRRVVLTSGALALAAALAGCSAGASSGTAPGAGGSAAASAAADPAATLRVGMAATPASLDFTTTGGAAIFQALLGNVYEGLVSIDENGAVQPLLASGYQVSDDGLRYTFDLRQGVTFSDGTPFTADVVKSSLERVKEWKANTPSNLASLTGVEVVSPTQAVVVLSKPDRNALFWLGGPLGAMFSPSALPQLATAPVGTGPYAFASYEPGVKMVLERNDSYWGEKAGNAQVDLQYYADASAAANALRTGAVDALFQSEAYDQVAAFQADPAYTVTTGTTQGVVVVSMNGTATGNPALADPRVRQAITYAIDKKAVMTAATSGFGTVLGGPAVPTDPYYADLSGTYAHDPAKAKALLAEAGASGLQLRFTVPTRPYAQAVAQVVQSELAEVGITVTTESQEFPAQWVEKTLTGKAFDLTVTNHVEPRNLWNYDNPAYYWGYDSQAARDDFARARAATDDAAYDSAVGAAVDQVVKDSAGAWIYNPPNIVIARSGVTGLPKDYMGFGIDFAGVTVASS